MCEKCGQGCFCRMQEKGAFTLVLSGGSLLKALTFLAKKRGQDFSKWHIFYADERNVPHTAEDSNHKGATDAFLSKVSHCICSLAKSFLLVCSLWLRMCAVHYHDGPLCNQPSTPSREWS